MIRSLESADSTSGTIACDVLIVGAGIAGLLAGERLTRAGKRVIVLESGAREQTADTHPLNEVVCPAATYTGASSGGFRCLGGTSTRWGGAMIPFQPADLDPALWPLALDDLLPWLGEVEGIFHLPSGSYELPGLIDPQDGGTPTHVARLGKWPGFANRNVAQLLRSRIESAQGPEIWLDANVTGFTPGEGRRVAALTARAPSGRTASFVAGEVILCAGAIESTRLLLLLDRACDQRLLAPHDVIGRYFHDHLSARTAAIVPRDRKRLNRTAGFRFEQGGMRNLRFELSRDPAMRLGSVPQFTHVGFAADEDGGFAALRDMLRGVQQRRLPAPATIGRLLASAPWLARAAWWRFAEQRVLYPADAGIEAVTVIEQQPVSANRITLSPGRRDMHGVPLAVIDWRIGEDDRHAMIAAGRHFARAWQASNLEALGEIRPDPESAVLAALEECGGIYHPGGSTRMATSASGGVVDRDLRVFGLDNLSVFSTSTFPSGGGANPTMMMIMAALRACDRIAPLA